MICVRLMGGLGNQMFQYAFGRSLAAGSGTELVLDVGWFATETRTPPHRRYSLDCFRLESRTVSLSERQITAIECATKPPLGSLLAWTVPLLGLPRLRVIRQQAATYEAAFASAPDNTLLVGYWQSERYFEPAADVVRRDFTFAGEPPELSGEILDSAAVGVHVRRGDYAAPGSTHDYHGTLDPGYYDAAIAHVAGRVRVERIFVFSDDPEWARRALHFDLPTTHVGEMGYADWQEMQLLSLCRHQVIANSSFSWWAAWLNDHPEKIVVAPKRWFSDPAANSDDLVPPGWHRL